MASPHRTVIKGGAGEFEAAVIAVVLDRIAAEERAARTGRAENGNTLPAWIRVLRVDSEPLPLDLRETL